MGAVFPDIPEGFVALGGAWLASNGHGLLGDGRVPLFSSALAELPGAGRLVGSPPSRHGRFDAFTKTGFAAVALALRSAGFEPDGQLKNVGLILASCHGCLETDLEFCHGSFPDAALASPNLFSYTLPGVALGECAVAFGLTGPALSVGDEAAEPGAAAVKLACQLLRDPGLEACAAGWLDAPPTTLFPDARRGAAVLVLGRAERPPLFPH